MGACTHTLGRFPMLCYMADNTCDVHFTFHEFHNHVLAKILNNVASANEMLSVFLLFSTTCEIAAPRPYADESQVNHTVKSGL